MMRSALVLMAAVACAMADESRGASLAVFKELGVPDVVIGMNLSVTVRIYNLGESAAFNVALDDTQWTNVGEGKGTKNEWDTIAPGDVKTVEYVIVPQEAGVMGSGPARVTFKDDTTNEQVKAAFSNNVYDTTAAIDGVPVLTEAEFEKKSSRRTKEWLTFVLLLLIPLGMPFFFYNQSTNNLKAKRAASKTEEAKGAAPKASPKRKNSPSRKSSPGKN